MANRYCKQCGKEVAPDKKFCSGCGQAVETTDSSPVMAAVSQATNCVKCGAELTPGRQFCKKCGQKVEAQAASVAVAEPIAVTPPTALAPPMVIAPPIATAQPIAVTPPVIASSPVATPPIEPPVPFKSDERSGDIAKSGFNSKQGIVIAVVAASLLLAVGGSGWLWYNHMHKKSAPSAMNLPIAGDAAQDQQAHSAPITTAESKTPPTPVAQPRRLTAENKPAQTKFGNQNQAEVKTTVDSPPSETHQSTASENSTQSGVLHYQGPPVPYNGQVVFDHLPAAKLHFTFDREAWFLTIKTNLDGTKKITLTSRVQGYQSSCEVLWAVM